MPTKKWKKPARGKRPKKTAKKKVDPITARDVVNEIKEARELCYSLLRTLAEIENEVIIRGLANSQFVEPEDEIPF